MVTINNFLILMFLIIVVYLSIFLALSYSPYFIYLPLLFVPIFITYLLVK